MGHVNDVNYADIWHVGYEYDDMGRVSKLTYPDDSYVTYEYDKLGRLRKIKDDSSNTVAAYTYDELGRRDAVSYANGAGMEYEFDMGNRLSSITNNFQEQTFDVLKFEYDTYDKMGNRKDCDITLGTTTLSEYDYGYDCLYELKEVDVGESNWAKYGYDKLGNRKKTIINSNTVIYSPDEMNKYKKVDGTTFSYSDNGNLTSDGVHSFTYDCENRLLTAIGVTYKYDFAGRRIRKIVGQTVTSYVYDGARVIAEYVDGDLFRKYIYGPGIDEPVCMIQWNGQAWVTYYYHYDGLGSVVGLSDEDGYLQEYYEYDVFGEPTRYYVYYPTHTLYEYNPGSGLLQPFMFTGREYDFDNGLYYYRFRFYHPGLGRFMQPDPIRYAADLNLYRYCLNNPVNWIDPFGLKRSNWERFKDWLEGLWGGTERQVPNGESKDIAEAMLRTAQIEYLKQLQNRQGYDLFDDDFGGGNIKLYPNDLIPPKEAKPQNPEPADPRPSSPEPEPGEPKEPVQWEDLSPSQKDKVRKNLMILWNKLKPLLIHGLEHLAKGA